jgi:hypothetical protein
MLEDINFTETGPSRTGGPGEIRIKIKASGATVEYPITELMAIVLLRQLGNIVGSHRQNDRAGLADNSEELGHVVEPSLPEATEAKEVGGA